MYKVLKLIFWAGIIFTLSGCEKFLTHDNPSGVTDDQWWETEAQARSALGSVYAGVPHGTSGRNVMLVSSLSDESVGRQSAFGDYEQFGKSLQNSDWNVALHIWRDDFINIRRANRFLENVDRVYMTNQQLKQRYIAEARALRAYYHLELLLFYGGIPIMRHSIEQPENTQARNTEEECRVFILEELKEAAESLPDEYTNAEAWRISRPACYAFIVRLSLFYRDFATAAEYAKKIIDLRVFELYSDYSKLFTYDGELNRERIFFKEQGAATAWDRFAPYGVQGRTVMSPTDVVVNNFETRQGKTIWELGSDSIAVYKRNPIFRNNRDPRLLASVLLPGQTFSSQVLDPFNQDNNNANRIGVQGSTATGYWVRKYLDERDRNGARTMNFMIIRYAEILLSYAEALIESGDYANPDVATYINQVRLRAGMPRVDQNIYNTQEKLRELVRRERQAEMAFEGQRFFDIRRWGIANTVMNGQVYGATNPATGETLAVEFRVYNPEKDVRYPIPRGEIQANPNMVQNPHYD